MKLVAYFSATGTTKSVAEKVATEIGADIFEIAPEVAYTKEDLNWMDKKSRSSVEMADKSIRPKMNGKTVDISKYDEIYIGFPIWWYVAPTIINTFLESYDMTGKIIVPFATSGGSGMGKTNEKLMPSCESARLLEGKVFKADVSRDELAEWDKGLDI